MPYLEELSFRTVFAFPKASKSGFESKTYSSIDIFEFYFELLLLFNYYYYKELLLLLFIYYYYY